MPNAQELRGQSVFVLVVDDNPGALQATAMAIEHLGCAALKATSARQALELLRSVTPDVVLTDLEMGEMSGEDLARQMHEFDPGVPVALMTGWEIKDLIPEVT